MEIVHEIEVLQGEIRNYNILEINKQVLFIAEKIIGLMGNSMSASEIDHLNTILEELFISTQSKDYQLLDDLFEFKLKPFCSNVVMKKEHS